MLSASRRAFDWPLLFLVLALSIWGCVTIVSATMAKDDALRSRQSLAVGTSLTPDSAAEARAAGRALNLEKPSDDAVKQAVWIGVGLACLCLFTLVDFQWLIYLQGKIYGLNVTLLLLVLLLPEHIAPFINGAKSWIRLGPFALQPAEFSKFFVLITLAAFLTNRQENIRQLRTVLLSLLYIAPILLLILKQPDFGTMLAVLVIWLGMLFFGGARLRHIGLIVGCGLLLFTLAWKSEDWNLANRPGVPAPLAKAIKAVSLKKHQKARLAVFLNPNPNTREAKDAAYQVNQGQIAIGAGQISGQGWGQGMQKRGGWVPENNTDFIFTVVAEELGFTGAAMLITLYFLLLLRTSWIASVTDNYFGALIAGGFTCLIAYHAIINLGMTMRVMPITGVPLPFFSYGGSSYLAFAAGIGLLQSVVRQRRT